MLLFFYSIFFSVFNKSPPLFSEGRRREDQKHGAEFLSLSCSYSNLFRCDDEEQ